jgi:hypothetical protein
MASALYQMYIFDEPLARILYSFLRGVLIGVQGQAGPGHEPPAGK